MDNFTGVNVTIDKSMTSRVLMIQGTRPDAVKMAMPFLALQKYPDVILPLLCTTGQHPWLASETSDTFGLNPDYHLELKRTSSALHELTSQILMGVTDVMLQTDPSLVLVHGDTTTAFASALAAFYLHIPVGHVEAGLRTSRYEYPYPEELNRRLITRIAELHFAPTTKAARNLFNEGVRDNVFVTGNTVVDALHYVLAHHKSTSIPELTKQFGGAPLVLVTCHRREVWGEPLKSLCEALSLFAMINPDVAIVWPLHPNPLIINTVKPMLEGTPNITLTDALPYNDFVHLLNIADLVVTDSGGVMEEASVFGVPTLVMRDETERPEALELDNVRLVGYNFGEMIGLMTKWLQSPPPVDAHSVFGDGTAGEEIAEIVVKYFKEKN